MANVGEMRGGIRERTRSRDHVVEEIVPSSAWTEDSNCHNLLVDLPDYKKEEVKLQVDNFGQITVSGERLADHNKYEYFERTYKAPDNSDLNKITGKFDGEILYVTVPKKAMEEDMEDAEEEASPANNERSDDAVAEEEASPANKERGDHADDHNTEKKDQNSEKTGSSADGLHNHKELLKKRGRNAWPLLDMIKRNKGILLTAVLAFSVGLMVSRTFQSTGD